MAEFSNPVRGFLTGTVPTSSGISIQLWDNHPLTWTVTNSDGIPIQGVAGSSQVLAGDVCAYMETAGFWSYVESELHACLIDYEGHVVCGSELQILSNLLGELAIQSTQGNEWLYATKMQEGLKRLLVSVVTISDFVEEISKIQDLIVEAINADCCVWVE